MNSTAETSSKMSGFYYYGKGRELHFLFLVVWCIRVTDVDSPVRSKKRESCRGNEEFRSRVVTESLTPVEK